MTTVLAVAALVLIWFALPLLIAPLALAAVVLGDTSRGRRRHRGPRSVGRLDVHSLPTVHPADAGHTTLTRAA